MKKVESSMEYTNFYLPHLYLMNEKILFSEFIKEIRYQLMEIGVSSFAKIVNFS
jgi:hypothetical protein